MGVGGEEQGGKFPLWKQRIKQNELKCKSREIRELVRNPGGIHPIESSELSSYLGHGKQHMSAAADGLLRSLCSETWN